MSSICLKHTFKYGNTDILLAILAISYGLRLKTRKINRN